MNKPCSRCGVEALRRQGHQWLCRKHYRFGQMRIASKRRGKTIPSHAELEEMLHPENRCRDCDEVMSWLSIEDSRRVISLQHYRDGTMAFVCRSCNTRHSAMPGDTYREMPKDHKRCPHCETVKPFTEFSKITDPSSGRKRPKSWCRVCSNEQFAAWYAKKSQINQPPPSNIGDPAQ